MENSNLLNAELNPTNGEENNNNSLQNNSGENTQNENIEKQNPKHFSGLFDMTPEEEERRTQEEADRELWERINEEDEKNSGGSEEEKKDVGEQLIQSTGRRHYKKNNLLIAGLKRTKTQKVGKDKRLGDEIDSLKADLARGYLIVHLGEDSTRVKHVQLDVSDKKVIKSVIAKKEFERYELGLDIGEIDSKIRDLASAKQSTYKDKLSKKKASKNEDDLVKRVIKEMDAAAKNGGKEIVSRIQKEVQAGNKDDAYKSLKSFLSENVKTVSRKLNKSKELESSVLGRVLDKQSSAQ